MLVKPTASDPGNRCSISSSVPTDTFFMALHPERRDRNRRGHPRGVWLTGTHWPDIAVAAVIAYLGLALGRCCGGLGAVVEMLPRKKPLRESACRV